MKKLRSILKKTLLLALVTALLLPYFSMGAYAEEGEYTGPNIESVSLNNTRSVITLTFDCDIEAAVSNFRGRVKISKNGAALSDLATSTQYNISGSRMEIVLSSSLDTANNYIQITADTLVNQTIALNSDTFDAKGPELAATNPVSVSASGRVITVRFKSAIKGYPNDESLMNGYISLARTGSYFSDVILEEDIEINNSKGEIKITLDEPISGNRARLKFAAGKIQLSSNGNINLDDIITPYINYSGSYTGGFEEDEDGDYIPTIKSANISSDHRTVTINFTDRIKNAFATTGTSAALAQTFIKSHVFISRGGLNNFEALSGADTITVGSNYIKITFNEPLIDNNNYIKFDKEALTDYNGNYFTSDIITDSVTNSSTATGAAPQYSRVVLSGSNKIIIYFSTTVNKVASLSQSELRSSISISRNGGSFRTLSSYDSVSFSSSTMTIVLDEPITGTKNRVKILPNTVASKAGVPLTTTITTDTFSVGSSSYDDDEYDSYYDAPQYQKVTYDAKSKRIRIYFVDGIRATSSATLLSAITISRNGSSYKALSTNDVVTISPQNAISILLEEPLTGTKNAVKIARGAIEDYNSGYILNTTVTTDHFNGAADIYDDEEYEEEPSSVGAVEYTGTVNTKLSDDLYTITLKFDEALSNNLSSLEQLKSKIQVSKNGKFTSLTANDYIRVNEVGNELLIVLAEPVDEYFAQVKIPSLSLRNNVGKAISTEIVTLPLGEAEGNARVYVNDFAVNVKVPVSDSATASVVTLSDISAIPTLASASELLIKLPSEKDSATLNISSSVADSIKKINGTFAFSFGEATYYLPSKNIPTLASGDVVSIKISKASSAEAKLYTASTKDNFEVEAGASTLSASIILASGSSKTLEHNALAGKRIMVKDYVGKHFFTAVRIEASGAVVPVPSNTDTSNGVLYLTAKALKDGDYSAVSATHTFANLPTWVTAPANTLGSKLILPNASGSDINASQAISRSETVTIITRTLGVFGDASGTSPFFDMIATDNYFGAVMSAVSTGLISGYPDGTFKPAGTLTRTEAMVIVARAMRLLNGKSVSQAAEISATEATTVLSKFTDAATIDNWAKADIAECVKAGVVNGDNNGRLNPKAKVTRAELIQLMYNLLNKANLL